MADRPSDEAVAAAADLYREVAGEATTVAAASGDELDDPNQFAVNCRAGDFKRRAAETLDAFRDRVLSAAYHSIVRPHLVGEADHDCAAEIARDLEDWLQRLRDGTACAACEGTGVVGDFWSDECGACGGSGERRK